MPPHPDGLKARHPASSLAEVTPLLGAQPALLTCPAAFPSRRVALPPRPSDPALPLCPTPMEVRLAA